MRYRIIQEADYLRAELLDRGGAEETRDFLRGVIQEGLRCGCSRILLCVRSSSTSIFIIEKYGVHEYFDELKSDPSHKIAIVGDILELGMTQDYLETLARVHGINIKSFTIEGAALAWFNDRRFRPDRRRAERRQAQESRYMH